MQSSHCDARDLLFDKESFDVVYSLGVVEHFDETYLAIKEHARVTKKDGIILITVPNLGLETFYRYYAFYKKGQHNKGSFMNIKGRNMRLTKLIKMMELAGVEVTSCGVSGTILSPIKRKWPEFYSKYLSKYERLLGAYIYALGFKK